MPKWLTRGVLGIILATFFSDVGHEAVTVILPGYLAASGLGAATLGAMEGIADFCQALAKLAGGAVGHHTEHKRWWAGAGYALTALGTAGIGLVSAVPALVGLRSAAWTGRGFRSPMRDFMMADEVDPKTYGRAYGIERSADMAGAVVGSLTAIVLVYIGLHASTVIVLSIVPAGLAALSFIALTRDRKLDEAPPAPADRSLPAPFKRLLVGLFLFGLGDFSRTFLILLAATALGEHHAPRTALSIAMLLYVGHNVVSAIVAVPVGRLADRKSKLAILLVGFVIGAVTNAVLAFDATSAMIVIPAIAISGVYIAIQETVEKATAASMLPRELRSWGLGVMASVNAVGDMASSLFVGFMLDAGHTTLAFAIPAVLMAMGVIWLAAAVRRPG
jgi:MFS family permease